MAKFNTKNQGTKIVNRAGGEAYRQKIETEFISILLTSFVENQYYRTANETVERLEKLIPYISTEKVAKSLIWIRNRIGMRSITHVGAVILAPYLSHNLWGRRFFEKVVHRPDDMAEMISYYWRDGKRPLPNAMKAGFAKAFDKFDDYQIAKYKMENRNVKLVDIVNLVHPKPTAKNEKALRGLIKGKLTSSDTWESELTRAGQKANTDEEKEGLKKDVWAKLISEKKIGYFALLRNLRNILEQAPEYIDGALEMLVDRDRIKKSLVLPFRFYTAYKQLLEIPGSKKVVRAISRAMDISLDNVPSFDGKTLVVIDESGSMGDYWDKAIIFACALYKKNDADLIAFSNSARYVNVLPDAGLISMAESIVPAWGGTNFHSVFDILRISYDRMIFISDMQGWVGYDTPMGDLAKYEEKFNCRPYIHSIDMAGYGDSQFPEDRIFCIAGFSEKLFDIMKLLEADKKALFEEIERIAL